MQSAVGCELELCNPNIPEEGEQYGRADKASLMLYLTNRLSSLLVHLFHLTAFPSDWQSIAGHDGSEEAILLCRVFLDAP